MPGDEAGEIEGMHAVDADEKHVADRFGAVMRGCAGKAEAQGEKNVRFHAEPLFESVFRKALRFQALEIRGERNPTQLREDFFLINGRKRGSVEIQPFALDLDKAFENSGLSS
jgi:hypothetical protein